MVALVPSVMMGLLCFLMRMMTLLVLVLGRRLLVVTFVVVATVGMRSFLSVTVMWGHLLPIWSIFCFSLRVVSLSDTSFPQVRDTIQAIDQFAALNRAFLVAQVLGVPILCGLRGEIDRKVSGNAKAHP